MENDLPPTKDISLESYLKLKNENSELQKKIMELESVVVQLKNEIRKLKSKRPHSGGIRID